jgi:hypothetical protein
MSPAGNAEEEALMLTLNLYRYPAAGKENEVRAMATEAVNTAKAHGLRVSLAQLLYHHDGPAFVSVSTVASLADLHAMANELNADPAWASLSATIGGLVRKPNVTQLFDVLVPAQNPDAGAPYVTRTQFYPAPAKMLEMRSLLEEYVHARHAEGRPEVRLLRELFPGTGVTFRVVTTFDNLADVEESRLKPPAAFIRISTQLGEISNSPLTMDFLQVIVPFSD